ncbi:MAG TPA: flagellar basal-body MS-ring/collar protein FliF [Candidatus Sulfotelmatobacter sp.]
MAAETPQSLNDVMRRLGQFFTGLSVYQKAGLAVGFVVVTGVLWGFVALLGQPKYVTLYSGLRSDEAQSLAGRLAAKNISHQISPDGGTLLVAEDKLDAARLETAAAGLPRSARMGFELFDTPNWTGSDFTEKVNFQRALEGELERTLSTLSEVQGVRVHLVLPQDSLFTEQQHEAKAAVILKTRSGRLSDQAQAAIPQLVASAVDRLRPENVTVVDADSNTPLLHGPDGGGRSFELDEELSKTLVRTLEPVVGADHIRASVHAEYDLGSSEDTQETYDPKSAATLTQEHAEESATGGAPAGVPGTASNVPAGTTPPVKPSGSEQSSSRSDSTTFAISKTIHHSVEPPGRVRRLAAAVLVDDAVEVSQQAGKRTTTRRKRTADEMKQIEQLARAAIGVDNQRGDVLAVENLSFQEIPSETLPPTGKIERWRQVFDPWRWSLRYVGLVALFAVIYILILRPIKKQALAAFKAIPAKIAARTLPQREGAAIADSSTAIPLEMNRNTQLKKTLTEKVRLEPANAGRLVQAWVKEGKD